MKTKDIIIGVAAVSLLGLLLGVWLAPSGLRQAPDVAFKTLDGRELSLAQLQGRPVLVNFWATTCPGCIKEMPHLVELYNKLSPQGFEIIGISMDYDPPSQVMAMQQRRQLPYPLTMDLDAGLSRAFGDVSLTPTSFLIAPDGRIVIQKIGELDMVELEARVRGMLAQPTGA